MPKSRTCPALDAFGVDVKAARNAMQLTRRALAERVNIDTRYLANIENSGALPSLPIFFDLVQICRLPLDKYFALDKAQQSELRERVILKAHLCPEPYLHIIEGALDKAIDGDIENE